MKKHEVGTIPSAGRLWQDLPKGTRALVYFMVIVAIGAAIVCMLYSSLGNMTASTTDAAEATEHGFETILLGDEGSSFVIVEAIQYPRYFASTTDYIVYYKETGVTYFLTVDGDNRTLTPLTNPDDSLPIHDVSPEP